MSFKKGLCGCTDNFSWCCVTWLAPCYTAGKIAENVDESCCLCGFATLLPIIGIFARTSIRGKLREKNQVDGSYLGDCCLHLFLPPCALCQEIQEIELGQLA